MSQPSHKIDLKCPACGSPELWRAPAPEGAGGSGVTWPYECRSCHREIPASLVKTAPTKRD